MKRFFFLPTEVTYGLLGLWLYSMIYWNLGYRLLVSLLVIVVLYALRRGQIPYRETLKIDGELYLSPVHGVVESIRRNTTAWDEQRCHEVRISIGVWEEKGLYLPTNGEASYLRANKGKKVSRKADSIAFYQPAAELAHTDLVLSSKNQTKTLLRFIDAVYGKRPTIWLKSGDRGRGAACFGYYPFGGTLLIYLPENSDILVFEKERIVPGQTVIATLKDAR